MPQRRPENEPKQAGLLPSCAFAEQLGIPLVGGNHSVGLAHDIRQWQSNVRYTSSLHHEQTFYFRPIVLKKVELLAV